MGIHNCSQLFTAHTYLSLSQDIELRSHPTIKARRYLTIQTLNCEDI